MGNKSRMVRDWFEYDVVFDFKDTSMKVIVVGVLLIGINLD